MVQKRINSKRKGNSAELELSKILTKRFGMPFARVGVSSGARVKNTKLPDNAIGVMTGDLIVPDGFRFSVESKAVNVNVDLLAPSALLDNFLEQVWSDAVSIDKFPLLCWKRNRKGWIAALRVRSFKDYGNVPLYNSRYHDGWLICRLDALLEIDDDRFWFEPKINPSKEK